MAFFSASNRVIELRSGEGEDSSRRGVNRRSMENGALASTPANLRVELRVKIDNLASRLLELGKWLTEHGCSHQVFHCVRAGSEAVIGVEFEVGAGGLLSQFQQEFVGSELTC